jgi:hypothetical protein
MKFCRISTTYNLRQFQGISREIREKRDDLTTKPQRHQTGQGLGRRPLGSPRRRSLHPIKARVEGWQKQGGLSREDREASEVFTTKSQRHQAGWGELAVGKHPAGRFSSQAISNLKHETLNLRKAQPRINTDHSPGLSPLSTAAPHRWCLAE